MEGAGSAGWAFAQLGWPAGPQLSQWGGHLFSFLPFSALHFFYLSLFSVLFYLKYSGIL